MKNTRREKVQEEKVKYKFNEDHILEVVKGYIDITYEQHYSKGNIQTTEIIFDADHGEGFCIGNIIKYAQRYGKKDGRNDADLYKIIHYAVILLGMLDKKEEADFVEYENQLQLDMD
jgi:hypothetical protein